MSDDQPKRMRDRPAEISKEQQLRKTMLEIKALTGADVELPPPVDLPPAPPVVTPIEFAPVALVLAAPAASDKMLVFEDEIEAQPTPARPAGIQLWSLLQVKDAKSDSFGTVFTATDVQEGQVHGFMFQPGRSRVYITADKDSCEIVGTGKVGVRQTRSPEWARKYPHATL